MKRVSVILLTGILCAVLIAAGCTNTAPSAPTATAVPSQTVAATAIPVQESGTWTGTWNSTYNSDEYGTVPVVIVLTQTGSSVTGTYNDGRGTLEGSLENGIVTGTWNDSDSNGTYSGLFAFGLSADGTAFTGTWVNTAEGTAALKTTANFWNGERVTVATGASPAVPAEKIPSWTGTWNSTWLEYNGNQTVSLISLTQSDSEVTGTYNYTYAETGTFTGSLNATVQGNKITGMYRESDDDLGFFVFELSDDQNSFTGRWAHASDGDGALENSTLTWNGARV